MKLQYTLGNKIVGHWYPGVTERVSHGICSPAMVRLIDTHDFERVFDKFKFEKVYQCPCGFQVIEYKDWSNGYGEIAFSHRGSGELFKIPKQCLLTPEDHLTREIIE